jgi:hypothetical protein
MRERYSTGQQRFNLAYPGNDVHEAEVGTDPNNLYFPDVSSCTALVALLDDETLLGAHFDKLLSNFDVYVMLQRMLEIRGGRAVLGMWVMGNLLYGENDARSFMSRADFRAGAMLLTFAEALDFAGAVRQFDQGSHLNLHYRVQAAGGGQAAIYSCAGPSNTGGFSPYGHAWMAQPTN